MDAAIKNGDWVKFTSKCEFNRDEIGKPLLTIIQPFTYKVLLVDVKDADVLIGYHLDDIIYLLEDESLKKIDVEFEIKQKRSVT